MPLPPRTPQDRTDTSSLPGYFQMRQPRAADMQPSPAQMSGFSAPSATESAFHVLASNPPDVTKSATFSTPSDTVPKGGTGGTGFVGFSQYFGANAPTARSTTPSAAAQEGPSPASAFDVMLAGPARQKAEKAAAPWDFKNLRERLGDVGAAQQTALNQGAERASAVERRGAQERAQKDERNAEALYGMRTTGAGLAAKPWAQLSEAEKQQYRQQAQALYGGIAL